MHELEKYGHKFIPGEVLRNYVALYMGKIVLVHYL